MICVSVLYPDAPNKTFNHDYYAATHMPLVMRLAGSFGLIRYEIDRGLAGGAPDSEPPFAAVGRLYFHQVGQFQSTMAAHGAEILGDIPNYTDIQPRIQISELTSVP